MITVVIPVKNRAELVKRTLKSLEQQTRCPAAVVLVDNGSTDDTLETLHKWAKDKPWVKVITELKPGAAAARNAGLELVTTPYVMFFDSDDVMPKRHIEQVCSGLIAAGKAKIAAFDMELTDMNGKVHLKRFRHGDAMRLHIFHSILSTQRCVLSTELVRSVEGWNDSLPCWNDWEFGLRLLIQEPKVEYILLDEPVKVYAQAESITGTNFSSKHGLWERALDAADLILANTKYRKLIDYRRAILAGHYRREGHREYAKGLTRGLWMKFIERYVSVGGRGVEYLSRGLD